jgi:methylenetetrahydrofolate--tRNA-(uracil-5-)-methyltransferase
LNAVGLLKREMEALDSLIIRSARAAALPAGDALAMDRAVFSGLVTEALAARPEIEIVRDEVREIPTDGVVVIATGPLTSEALDREIGKLLGTEDLYFYDSIAPVVVSSSLDFSKMYAMSRYGKGDGDDYWNCPLDRGEYEAFVSDLLAGETVPVHDFEKGIYFEGCLPIEVMAERGRETLRHGPLKPMGLNDPRTGRMPWAVVQLRQDDLAREHYNLVGFQTKLKIPEQQRIFRKIPGLADAVFARYGMLHRNTYIRAPAHLDRFWRMRREPRIFFAGQITGVEGYVESAATGLAVGLTIAQILEGREPVPVPYTTAIGSLARHCSERPPEKPFEPMNVTFGLIEDTSHSPVRDKAARRKAMVERALAAIGEWKMEIAAGQEVAR